MRQVSVVLLLMVFLVSGGGVAVSRGQEDRTDSERRTLIALDLMDLEIPGEGSGDEMELPPIQGAERREEEPASETLPREPAEVERGRREAPEESRSAPSPAPGLAPFLLEDPGVGGGSTGLGTDTTGDPAPGELPVELKTVPPPPSRAESLKLPSGGDASASGRSDVPEIPLLKSQGRGEEVPTGQDPSFTMKPLPDLRGTPGTSGSSRPLPESRRPEDYLQLREAMDERLIDLYERYYKDR